jgi:hypothetical protein
MHSSIDFLWSERLTSWSISTDRFRMLSLTRTGDTMRKLTLALALPALSISACVALSAQATPRMALPSPNQSAIQQIGCTSAGARCPLGKVRVRLAVFTMVRSLEIPI